MGKLAVAIIAAMLPALAAAQTVEQRVKTLIGGKHAEVGVAWLIDGKAHTVNNADGYPLMSVFKLHGAIAALRQMERSGIPTDTSITVMAEEMMADTYSPMQKRYAGRDFTLPLDSLLHYSVAESDNNACDIIIRLAGGIQAVVAEMRAIGLTDFKLKDILLSTTTGQNKLKAALKPGMTLAHKTGTGFPLPDGTLTADNDAGVITLPDGRRIYIAVLIKDSKLGAEGNARLMREIAEEVIEHQ